MRLNARRDPQELPASILSEVVELNGAERAALFLADADPAAMHLPAGESQADFVRKVQPVLKEVASNGQPMLRYMPEKAAALKQRSILCVPLIAAGKQVGAIYTELAGSFGRFTRQDLDLLTVLANQSAVALENARWTEGLEQKVAERTTELETAKSTAEQAQAELAIINEIQQGLASELNFQAIVDLAGDRLRQVFNVPDLFINWFEEKTKQIIFLYAYEHGKRLNIAPAPLRPDTIIAQVIRTRRPVVWNTMEEGDKIASVIPGTDPSKSGVSLPMISGDRVLGVIQLENYEREHAFGEAEIRLLTTVTASLGAALENARLFDETQRLLKETEQRAAELAIINSVQEALASKLDMQAIYDLVGDKIQQLFNAQSVIIELI